MSILLIILIIVLFFLIFRSLQPKENFDNNCVYKMKPQFTLRYSNFFETDKNGDISIDDDGYVVFKKDVTIDMSDEVDNDLKTSVVEDLNEMLQNPFNPSYKLLDKTNCLLSY